VTRIMRGLVVTLIFLIPMLGVVDGAHRGHLVGLVECAGSLGMFYGMLKLYEMFVKYFTKY